METIEERKKEMTRLTEERDERAKERVKELIKNIDRKVTPEEKRKFENLFRIRKKLSAYLSNSFIINNMRNIIGESKYVSFFNKRSEKFIDEKRPIFKISIDINEHTLKDFPNDKVKEIIDEDPSLDVLNSEQFKTILDYKLNILDVNIVSNLLDLMIEELIGNLDRSDADYKADLNDMDNKFIVSSLVRIYNEASDHNLLLIEYLT